MSSELQCAHAQTPSPLLLSSLDNSQSKKVKFDKSKSKPAPIDVIKDSIWVNVILPFLQFNELSHFFRCRTNWKVLSQHPYLYKSLCIQQGILVQGNHYEETVKKYKKLLVCLVSENNFCSEHEPLTKSITETVSMCFFESFFKKMVTLDSSGKLREWPFAAPIKIVRSLQGGIEKAITIEKRVILGKEKTIECWNFATDSPNAEAVFNLKETGVKALAFKHPYVAVSTLNHFYICDIVQKKIIKAWNDAHNFLHLHFVNEGIVTLSAKGTFRFICLSKLKMAMSHVVPGLEEATSVHMFSNRVVMGFKEGRLEVWEWNKKQIVNLAILKLHKSRIADITHCSFKIFAVIDSARQITVWDMANLKTPLKVYTQKTEKDEKPCFIRFNLIDRHLSTLNTNDGKVWQMSTNYYNTQETSQ